MKETLLKAGSAGGAVGTGGLGIVAFKFYEDYMKLKDVALEKAVEAGELSERLEQALEIVEKCVR